MSEVPALVVKMRSVQELRADPRNAKRHDRVNVTAIAESLRRFGQRKPIVTRQGVVIAGNGTLEAATKLGWTEIACTEAQLTETEARAYALADNRVAELAQWDEGQLAYELGELQDDGVPIDALGWDGDQLARLLGEGYDVEVAEIDVSDASPRFWLQVQGPLRVQPEVLERLREALAGIDGIDVEMDIS